MIAHSTKTMSGSPPPHTERWRSRHADVYCGPIAFVASLAKRTVSRERTLGA